MEPVTPTIVIDTNVWISGLVFGGKPEKIIRAFLEGQVEVVMSEELMSELRRKITQRFPLYIPKLDQLEAAIREDVLFVQLGFNQVTASRDADDNKVLETAIAGKAKIIVSGDTDLLELKQYERIAILKPADFLEQIINLGS